MIRIEMKDLKHGWRYMHKASGEVHIGNTIVPLCEAILKDNPKLKNERVEVVNAKTGKPRYWIRNIGEFVKLVPKQKPAVKKKPLPDLFG